MDYLMDYLFYNTTSLRHKNRLMHYSIDDIICIMRNEADEIIFAVIMIATILVYPNIVFTSSSSS